MSHLGWMLRCPWGDQKSNRVSLYRLSFFPTKETSPGIAFILSSVAWLFCGHGERVKLNILSKHMMMILHYLVNKIFRNFYKFKISINVGICCCSVAQSCPTVYDTLDCSTPGFPVLHPLPELAQTHVHWVDDAIQPSHSLSSPSPPAFNLFSIRVFFSESALHIRWPKYWCFSFSISPSKEYSGLISFRIDWFDLLAIQGSLKNLLQHHDLKVSIIWCSACFMV